MAEYYRAYEERYRQVYALGAQAWRNPLQPDEELKRFLAAQRLPAGDAIDLGCGEGIDAIFLAGQAWRVVGVDVSATAIGRASELAAAAGATVDFRVEDILKLSDDASFDLALSISTLHMFIEDQHRLRYLQETYRLLRPGGWLFLDCLGLGHALSSRALPQGHPVAYELTVGDEMIPITLPAVPSIRLSNYEVQGKLRQVGFSVRRLYRVGEADYRRIICWASKVG